MEPAAGYEMGDGRRAEAGVGEIAVLIRSAKVLEKFREILVASIARKRGDGKQMLDTSMTCMYNIRSLSNLKLHSLPIIREISSI